jgi:hypothetical protein
LHRIPAQRADENIAGHRPVAHGISLRQRQKLIVPPVRPLGKISTLFHAKPALIGRANFRDLFLAKIFAVNKEVFMAEQVVREYAEETFFPAAFKRISWGAVFAGTIVAIMVSLVLGILGVAVGAATINPMSEQNPAQGLQTTALIWLCVATLIALFVGGCVSGRLAGVGRRVDAMLHGVVTWGLTTLFTLFLLTSAIGGLLGGATSLLSGVAQNPSISQINEPSGAENETEAMKQKMKQALVDAGKTPEEADKAVDAWTKKMQGKEVSESAGAEAEQTAREAGSAIASGASKAAWGAFIALLVGAIAAAIGGASGVPRDLRERTGTVVRPAV